MSIRYKCLILDHDDTAVNSTAMIHYPAHIEIMKRLRPDQTPVSLNGWFKKNYHPGVMEYYTEELGFSEEEIHMEYNIWRKFTNTLTPDFFSGFMEFLIEYKNRGGIITVVSHSDCDIIEKHYACHSNGSDISPDIIFGWDSDKDKRKPNPYPVQCILEKLNISEQDALILDDLKPGLQMGRAAGVCVAAAGWGHQVPEIRTDMKENCDLYFSTVREFRDYVLQ